MNVQFINNLSSSQDAQLSHSHQDGEISHSHDLGEHGHTHEHLDHPGNHILITIWVIIPDALQASSQNEIYLIIPKGTSRKEASRLVLAGLSTTNTPLIATLLSPLLSRPVGSGKTALTLALCKRLREQYNIGQHLCLQYTFHEFIGIPQQLLRTISLLVRTRNFS